MPLKISLDERSAAIRLTGEIDMKLALELLDELSLLHSYYQYRTIELQINSPGGEAAALHYLVEQLAPWRKAEGRILRTVGISDVASAAALLLSLGSKGERTASKHTRLLYHAARTVYGGGTTQTGSDLRVVTRRLEKWDEYFVDIITRHNAGNDADAGASYKKKLRRLFDQERYITAEEACKLRLIDRVVERTL